MQYHAFSTALLGLQVYESRAIDRFTRKRFLKALEALDLLTLPGGQCNYWGRGQGQIFGYTAAILAFALGYQILGDLHYLQRAWEIISYIKRYVREDGSMPLVLREEEPPTPVKPNVNDPRFLGWYSYNNYFDYLAFAGALLLKTSTILSRKTSNRKRPSYKRSQDNNSMEPLHVFMSDVLVFSNETYTAVVTRPFSTLASTMPMPYIAVSSQYPLPCYGGEECGSLYTSGGLPLPILIDQNGKEVSVYDFLRFRFVERDTIEGRCSFLTFMRKFKFLDRSIVIKDKITFGKVPKGWKIKTPRFLLYKGTYKSLAKGRVLVKDLVMIRTDSPYLFIEKTRYFSAFGELVAFHGPPIKVEDLNNNVIESTIWIDIIGD